MTHSLPNPRCESWLPVWAIGTMGRSSPSHVRRRSGSSFSRRLTSKSRSPLQRTASFHTPRAVLTPRSRCSSRGAPSSGTPRSQRQRAPSPRRMKCESPRDPEKRHRAWLRGELVASPVPVPFGEVPGEFSPGHQDDLSAAPPTRRRRTSAGQCFFDALEILVRFGGRRPQRWPTIDRILTIASKTSLREFTSSTHTVSPCMLN